MEVGELDRCSHAGNNYMSSDKILLEFGETLARA